jgi:hypothetical protein
MLALACAALPATLAAPAHAQESGATVDLRAVIGVRGYCEVGTPVVVTVNLAARQAFQGTLAVSNPDTGAGTVTTPAEIAGGAEKQFRLVTSCSDWGRVVVQARAGDDVVAEESLQAKVSGNHELVGVMPALFDRAGDVPEEVPLDGDVGRAVLVELMPDDVALGPSALDVFDTIAASGGDLAALTADERGSLLTWVGEGGRLLLDDDTQTAGLPRDWRPGGAGYAWAGAGEVRLTDGAAAGGSWGSIIHPSPYRAAEFGAGNLGFGMGPEQSIVDRSGLDQVSLNTWLIALAAYALVVGPIAYMVLRSMRRLTLAWVVIPLLAVATGGTVLAAGSGLRGGAHQATGSYVETSAGGATALTTALVLDGDAKLDLPPGWTLSIDPYSGGFVGGIQALTTVDTGGRAHLELGLEAGQSAITTLEGSATIGALTTTAEIRGKNIAGTVTNGTGMRLGDVVVFAGQRAVEVGALQPGATAAWKAPLPRRVSPLDESAQRVWGGFNQFGESVPKADGSLAEPGVWESGIRRHVMNPTGYARVAGWTEEWQPPGGAGDGSSDVTVISSVTPINNGDGALRAAAVRATVVRSPFTEFGESALGNDVVIRYLLPPDADPDAAYEITQLAEDAGDGSGIKIWTDDGWETVNPVDGRVDVPSGAVRSGIVLTRATVRPDKIDPSIAVPLLHEWGADA